MTLLEVSFIWGQEAGIVQPEGSWGGPEQLAAFLTSSERSESHKGMGNKVVIWKASFPIQNLHLQILRTEVWEKTPKASGGLPQMPC